MSGGLSDSVANMVLDLVLRGQAFPLSVTSVYVQIHDGDPTQAGTGNVYPGSTRVLTTFSSPISGVSSNAQTVFFPSLQASVASFFTLWDASTNGNCLAIGTINPTRTINADDGLVFGPGQIVVSVD